MVAVVVFSMLSFLDTVSGGEAKQLATVSGTRLLLMYTHLRRVMTLLSHLTLSSPPQCSAHDTTAKSDS